MTELFNHTFDSKYQFPRLADTKINGMHLDDLRQCVNDFKNYQKNRTVVD